LKHVIKTSWTALIILKARKTGLKKRSNQNKMMNDSIFYFSHL